MVVTLQRMGMPAGRHFRKGGGVCLLCQKLAMRVVGGALICFLRILPGGHDKDDMVTVSFQHPRVENDQPK